MERHLLVTVSEKYDHLFGVRFLGIFFPFKEGIKITLLYLTPRPSGAFEADRDAELQARKSEATGRKALEGAKGEFLRLGFSEDQVSTKLRARRLSKVQEIIQEGTQGKYDAVVVGSRGLSWLEHAFDESVTRVLFEETWDFPLWVCRKPDPPRKGVLACVDGSEAASRMLNHAAFMLKKAQDHPVTLLTISRKGNVGEKSADEILQESRTILIDDGIPAENVRFQVIHEASPGKAILRQAGAERYAVVAAGRTGTGMGLLKKVFVGSVSRTLFHELEGAALWLA